MDLLYSFCSEIEKMIFKFNPNIFSTYLKLAVFQHLKHLGKPWKVIIRGVFMGGVRGAKPPPGPVQSIDFRGFSGPNGC